MKTVVLLALQSVLAAIGPAGSASAQIYKLADMNTRQILALDRQRTVGLIPGGSLEEPGPTLPSSTDAT